MKTHEKEAKSVVEGKPNLTKLKLYFFCKIFYEKTKRTILINTLRAASLFKIENLGKAILILSIALVALVTTSLLIRSIAGIRILEIEIKNQSEIQYWGQLGDFFGGLLNPLLSFMALMAVLYTIKLQREELKEAREENRLSNKIQDKQTEIFERQNFESVLFRLLDVHVKITERLMNQETERRSVFCLLNKQATEELLTQEKHNPYIPSIEFGEIGNRILQRQHHISILSHTASIILEVKNSNILSHYYRNMYQMLKLIDSYKAGAQGEKDPATRYLTCRQYSNMLRALLTNDELIMLTLNCLTKTGGGLKRYVEKYSLLKHLEPSGCLTNQEIALKAYNELAFTDYEKIKPSAISNFYT